MYKVSSEIYWCPSCNNPLLGGKCCRCQATGIKATKDLRFVFPEEYKELSIDLQGELPQPLFYNKSRYYACGKSIGSLRIGEKRTLKLNKFGNSLLSGPLEERNTNEEIISRLIECNSEYIRNLEEEAIDFIKNTVFLNGNVVPMVAFSGGKDSTVIAHLVQKALGHVNLFFGDTTIEYPDTYEYVNRISKLKGFSLIMEKSDSNFYEMCSKMDPPSQRMRWCCTVFKAYPLNKFLSKNRSSFLFFDGIRKSESSARSVYPRIDINKKASGQIIGRPILEWSTLAVWIYIFTSKLPYNKLYHKGFGRVGCMYCPYNTMLDDYLLKVHYPEQWNRWVSLLKEYLQNNYIDKYSLQDFDIWLKGGWKHRLPRRKKVAGGSCFCNGTSQLIYDLDANIEPRCLEFFKPLGEIIFYNNDEFQVGFQNPYTIQGRLKSKTLILQTNSSKEMKTAKTYVTKQLSKYLNCIGCGGCVGVCPKNAIDVFDGKVRIDETKCLGFGCIKCIKTEFANGRNCVILGYRGENMAIQNFTVFGK